MMISAFSLLDRRIVNYLKAQGIEKPTPIQQRAIPRILKERENFLLIAPTGTGKTEAALLPLLQKVLLREESGFFGILVLYITPLKALNRDVFRRVKELCELLGLTIDVRHGDTTRYRRRKQALQPPNILITTPETLQAILPGKRMRFNLSTVMAVVVDEVHEIVDSKRGAQLSLALERLDRLVRQRVQRIGLSATVGNVWDVARLLGGTERGARPIWAGYEVKKLSMRVEMPVPNDTHYKLAQSIAYPPHSVSRLQRIMELVQSHRSTIVFTNTRSHAEVLGAKLRLLKPSFDFDVHHGSLSREARLSAEDRLRTGRASAIIATSSLELGIDIGYVDLVIQYSSPRQVTRALQRMGRAGHKIDDISEGVIISTMNVDDVSESGVILRRARADRVEKVAIPKNALDVLAHQIVGIVLDGGQVKFDTLFAVVRGAYPYETLPREKLDDLIRFLNARGIVRCFESKIGVGARGHKFYFERLSMIPDVRQVPAVDSITRTSIGVLDEDYVREYLEPGFTFVIRGRPYRVVSIEEQEVLCQPITLRDSEAPHWIGELIPVPFEVAAEVAKTWQRIAETPSRVISKDLQRRYHLSVEAATFLVEAIKRAAEQLHDIPTEDRLVIEETPTATVVHAPLGSRGNETFGLVLAALLTTRLGAEVAVEHDPYRIMLVSNEPIAAEDVAEILKTYDESQVSEVIRLVVRGTQTFASRFLHVARRMGVISSTARVKEIPVERLIRAYAQTPLYEEAMREVMTEKMDSQLVCRFFQRVQDGTVHVSIVKRSTPSVLARLIIEEKSRFEVIARVTDEDEILRLLEERLLSRKAKLVCMKGDWRSTRTVATLEEKVICPRCGGSLIAVTKESDRTTETIIQKRLRGESLEGEEKKRYRRASLSASLVAAYGRDAVMVLVGRGIGPETAARILKPGVVRDRKSLLKEVAKAERTYARTRGFW